MLFDRVAATHSEIVLVGRSLGTGIAVQVASQRPLHKLVLVTPYDSLASLAASQFPYFLVRLLLRDRYDSVRYAPQVTAPTLIIAAEHDEVIPAHSTARLLAHFAKVVATHKVVAGTGHNTVSDSPAYTQALAWARD
ncbi:MULTISPECIES: alpha/beta hydrolase [unclassified Massilia]|uniref:alpha/beta hydrolase n=1 Tax=unclassified Massilia TaxID=2609279 RepID=UPI001E32FC89|nr:MULTISPECIES: dienelactone hydrolase family protein [unclassified Massilia]